MKQNQFFENFEKELNQIGTFRRLTMTARFDKELGLILIRRRRRYLNVESLF